MEVAASSAQWGCALIDILGIVFIAMGLVVLFAMGTRLPPRASPLRVGPPPLPPPEPIEALSEFERLAKERGSRRDKRRIWLRPVGIFGRVATYALLFVVLLAYWPEDISHKPLGALTLSDLFGTVCAVAVALMLLRALFSPSEDEDARDAWEVIGLLMLAGAGIGAVVLLRL